MDELEPPIKRTRVVLAYANEYLRLYDDEVVMPDGRPGRYLRLMPGEGAGGAPSVVVVARNDAGQTAFVRIYRYGLAQWCLELPMGNGEPGETPSMSALRELLEETGLHGSTATPIGRLVGDSSYDGAYIEVVLAEGVTGDPAPQLEEAIDAVYWLDGQQIRALIGNGGIIDGVTISALAIAWEVSPLGQADPQILP